MSPEDVDTGDVRTPGRRTETSKNGEDRGAAIVEIALVLPLFAMLLFGIIEFGWAFTQNLDVRHGAQEGARLAAVNWSAASNTGATQTNEIIAELCDRMDYPNNTTVTLTFDSADTSVGSSATLLVSHQFDDMTGFYSSLIGEFDLDSTIEFRLERNATWSSTANTGQACP